MMTVTDWIQAIFTVVLVGVTAFYAWRTHAMSKAAKEQADASVKMAEEMKRPYVLLRLDVMNSDVIELKTKFPPEELKISAINAGSGPAINLEAFFYGKKYKSPSTTKGYLVQNEQWKASIMGLDIVTTNESVFLDSVKSELVKKNITYAIIVGYEDIHTRKFASYLAIEFIENRYLFDGEQNIVELKI